MGVTTEVYDEETKYDGSLSLLPIVLPSSPFSLFTVKSACAKVSLKKKKKVSLTNSSEDFLARLTELA
jgi:hypothetical protein